MNRSWVRFPQAAQKRPPLQGWAFLYALTGGAAWCARGRWPARSPSALRASLGASTRCPARPCHHPRAPQPGPSDPPAPSTPVTRGVLCVASPRPLLSDFARNSPAATSNHEFRSSELQRLWMVSKSDRGKLCATFGSLGSCHRPWAPQPRARDSSHAAHTDRLLLSG